MEMERKRPNWHEYFFQFADHAKKRSTCNNGMVGAVYVNKDNHILSTGYNGSPPGLPHCFDVGCDRDESGHCIRTTHAEKNGIAQAARNGVRLKDSILYVTMFPCYDCFKQISTVGVKIIHYDIEYKPEKYAVDIKRTRDGAKLAGIQLISKAELLKHKI